VQTLAVLPVKRFGRAKQRLAPDVPPDLRRALAEAMAADVLDALARVSGIDELVVVTGDRRARELAQARGAHVLGDRGEAGQSAAAALAIAQAGPRFDRVLLVAGDCPALEPLELSQLLAREPGSGPEVVIVPDRHRTGTNALLLAPPDVIAPAFGPGSRARHMELAAEAGVPCVEAELPTVALDVDEASDLDALREALDAPGDHGVSTREVLRRMSALAG
jgi:2-phospho-L-lactate guanylyltransferase